MSGRPRLLDLFCGAGGAAVGYNKVARGLRTAIVGTEQLREAMDAEKKDPRGPNPLVKACLDAAAVLAAYYEQIKALEKRERAKSSRKGQKLSRVAS